MESQSKQENDAPSQASKPAEPNDHLTGWRLIVLLVGLFLTILIVTLDLSIVATAVPRITDEFDTIADIGWYVAAFGITQSALTPFAGRIYSIFSFKLCFLVYLAIFELGSTLCGAAQSSLMLVIGRAVCGIGSSGLINGSLAIVGIASPPEKKSLLMGLFMAVSGVGQVIGPLVGGGLTQHVSWRWCFYINLPFGAVTVASFVPIRMPEQTKRPWTPRTLFWDLDLPGFAIFAPACVMLLLAVNWGGTEYAWSSATIIGMLCGGLVTFGIFAFWELRQQEQAMIPPSILRRRGVYVSSLLGFLHGGAMLVLIYYLVLWFQVIKGVGPATSGVYTLPSTISQILASVASGVLLMKIHWAVLPLLTGNVLGVISYGLFTTFTPSTGAGLWIGFQILAGFGRGMAIQIPLLLSQQAVAKADIAIVTSVVMWAQWLGSSTCLTIAQNIFVSQLKHGLRTWAPSVDAGEAIEAGATAFVSSVAERGDEVVEANVLKAYNHAIVHVFYLGLAVSILAAIASVAVGKDKIDPKAAMKPGKPQPEGPGGNKDAEQGEKGEVSTVQTTRPESQS
jgi:MFS family permease